MNALAQDVRINVIGILKDAGTSNQVRELDRVPSAGGGFVTRGEEEKKHCNGIDS